MTDNPNPSAPPYPNTVPPGSISIVIPCHNEEAGVGLTVGDFASFCAGRFPDWQILAMDDGSTDGTGAAVDRLAAEYGTEHLTSLRHTMRMGYGSAVRDAIRETRGDLVLLTDGDYQYRASDLDRFVRAIDRCDMVVGYRARRAEGAGRRLQSSAYNLLIKRLFGGSFRDVNCAFKLIRGDLVRSMPLLSAGFGIDAEILVRAARAGARIREMEVAHHPRAGGASSVRIHAAWSTFREILRLKRALG